MATTIKWIDNNTIETAHRIYKSSSYFTKDNLPVPLVELGPDITEYVDTAGVDGENWYIVSALLNDYEVFSEPFIAGINTAYIHDVFGDGSAVATYNFDGDATDLGGNYNGTWSGTESYVAGVDGQAASFDLSSYVSIPSSAVPLHLWNGFSISIWVKSNVITNNYNPIFSKGIDACIQFRMYPSTGTNLRVVDGSGNKKNLLVSSYYPSKTEFDHIVISIDITNNSAYVFVNGVEAASSMPFASSFATSSSDLLIAAPAGASGFSGIIDQLRIFNRALTQQEVDNLYQEGAQYL